MKAAPRQPDESTWAFVRELRQPLHTRIALGRREKRPAEADLSRGVTLRFAFPDPDRLLETAEQDFRSFLDAARIPTDGLFEIGAEQGATDGFEAYRVEVTHSSCRILANDTEGIRRGLVFVEDEILRADGPFLPVGTFERSPVVKTRISRCFFGPINRPPRNRDELLDDIDYYPDAYLNRLAHEGVNGLWLSIKFSDLCTSQLFPEHGTDAPQRLAKLRQTITKCRRYGIRIYLYCNEPFCFGAPSYYTLPMSHLDRHPELGGPAAGGRRYFCTSSGKGRAYLKECTRQIFAGAPGLGGLINICFGEHPTHCNSSFHGALGGKCPRCAALGPERAIANMLSALAEGMHEVDAQAECIAWFYVPIMRETGGLSIESQKQLMCRIMAHMPEQVICQYNFESNGEVVQQGKRRVALDYWLAWPVPSKLFEDCARNALGAGARVSAKIQVGCSHEVATVPFVPVPGILYRKYSAMHELGVSAVMQCWYFGNYPGLMNKAAGELAFAPLPESEDAFLLRLAGPMWGRHTPTAVKAWQLFAEGYSQFPVVLTFCWFGPMHDAVVWPLHLVPIDARIGSTWLLNDYESGDRIGECLCYEHTLAEAVELLERMAQKWAAGVALLEQIAADLAERPERLRDIAVAKALGIQIAAARNVFRFYQLREQLPYAPAAQQREMLDRMIALVEQEIANGHELKTLCENDSRLGFHSEAEGYKYWPAKIAWRIDRLQEVLANDVPRVQRAIEAGNALFPEYTGRKPAGPSFECPAAAEQAAWRPLTGEPQTNWRAYHNGTSITFEFKCRAPADDDSVTVELEPRRLWPAQLFTLHRNGTTVHDDKGVVQDHSWRAAVEERDDAWRATIEIPAAVLRREALDRPVRINLVRNTNAGNAVLVEKHALPSRLIFGTSNHADLAWLHFV